jgi:hypothetical protein
MARKGMNDIPAEEARDAQDLLKYFTSRQLGRLMSSLLPGVQNGMAGPGTLLLFELIGHEMQMREHVE